MQASAAKMLEFLMKAPQFEKRQCFGKFQGCQ
jgi:hypothetical protein